jgi:Bacterial SH3 domain
MRCMAFAVACSLLLSGSALGAAGDYLIVVGDSVNVRSGPSTDSPVRMQVYRNQLVVEIERQDEWVQAEVAGTGGAKGWIHGSLLAPPDGERLVPPATLPRTVAPATPPAAPAPAAVPPEALPPAEPAEPAAPPAAGPAEPVAPLAAGPAEEAPPDTPELAATAPEPALAAAPTPEPLPPDAITPGAGSDIEPGDLQRFRDSVAYLNSRSMSVAGVDLFTEVEPLGGGAVQVGATAAWASIPPAGQRSYANALLDRWAAATGRADQVSVQIVDQGGQVLMEESKP